MCKRRTEWTRELPLILLGLRCTYKEHIKASPAEMVFGCTLRLPGELFENSKHTPQSDFVQKLKATMQNLRATDTSHQNKSSIFVHSQLSKCTHVFVRVDKIKTSLTPPYDGPYAVEKRNDKVFTLTIKGKKVNISIDRLKPAYTTTTRDMQPPEPSQPDITTTRDMQPATPTLPDVPTTTAAWKHTPNETKKTRSGRTVRLPIRFQT